MANNKQINPLNRTVNVNTTNDTIAGVKLTITTATNYKMAAQNLSSKPPTRLFYRSQRH